MRSSPIDPSESELKEVVLRQDWLSLLRAINDKSVKIEDINDVLQLPAVKQMIESLLVLPDIGKPYGRNVLLDSEAGEVLLVKWAENIFSALHDHGVGKGYIFFIVGEFYEEFWSWRDSSGELSLSNQMSRKSGDFCGIDHSVIHRVKAMRGGCSLHFYVPGSSGMRLFDVENRRTLLMRDDCGAWIDEFKVIDVKCWEEN